LSRGCDTRVCQYCWRAAAAASLGERGVRVALGLIRMRVLCTVHIVRRDAVPHEGQHLGGGGRRRHWPLVPGRTSGGAASAATYVGRYGTQQAAVSLIPRPWSMQHAHAVTEFCSLSQQITLNQDCMPGHAWICMRIANACMQRLAQPPGSPHSRPRPQASAGILQPRPGPVRAGQPPSQPPKGPIRAIKVKKWPQRAKIQANPGQQPASSQISTWHPKTQ
jgi:hypothetical protein